MDTVLNPLLYASIVLVIWQCYRLRAQHRRFWGVGLYAPGKLSVARIVAAVAAGAVLSAVFAVGGLNFGLTAAHSWWLWAAVLLLGLVRVRLMGFSYAAGSVSLLSLFSQWVDASAAEPVIRSLLLSLKELDVANLLLFTGLLTVAGGLFTAWQGEKAHCPVLQPWRGKSIGTFFLQSFWAVPVLLPTVSGGWLVFPVLLVYNDLAVSREPQKRAHLTGLWTVCFGVTLAIIGWAGNYTEVLLWAGAIWALLGQEIVMHFSYRQEHNGVPKFQESDNGIRVLAVKEGSPAADMGIRPGETITHANGQAVHSMTELYAALQRSPAFCKLEVVDENNEQRFVQRSLYANEPHQLGVVPVDDSPRSSGRHPYRFGWWSLLMGRTDYRENITKNSLDA